MGGKVVGALRDLAARLRAVPPFAPEPSAAEPEAVAIVQHRQPSECGEGEPPPDTQPPAPSAPPQPLDGWGLSEADKAAALARLAPVSPAVAWCALPYGAERGRAFAETRRQPGACPNCSGRRWWCETGEADAALRCATCHPADHLPTGAVREVLT